MFKLEELLWPSTWASCLSCSHTSGFPDYLDQWHNKDWKLLLLLAFFTTLSWLYPAGVAGVSGDVWETSSPTPLLKKGHTEQVAQDVIQTALEYLQRWRPQPLWGACSIALLPSKKIFLLFRGTHASVCACCLLSCHVAPLVPILFFRYLWALMKSPLSPVFSGFNRPNYLSS